jgi:uncharacterized membrane protein YhfC
LLELLRGLILEEWVVLDPFVGVNSDVLKVGALDFLLRRTVVERSLHIVPSQWLLRLVNGLFERACYVCDWRKS